MTCPLYRHTCCKCILILKFCWFQDGHQKKTGHCSIFIYISKRRIKKKKHMYRVNFLPSWQMDIVAFANFELLSNQRIWPSSVRSSLIVPDGWADGRMDGRTYRQTISLLHSYCIMKFPRFVFVHMYIQKKISCVIYLGSFIRQKAKGTLNTAHI